MVDIKSFPDTIGVIDDSLEDNGVIDDSFVGVSATIPLRSRDKLSASDSTLVGLETVLFDLIITGGWDKLARYLSNISFFSEGVE